MNISTDNPKFNTAQRLLLSLGVQPTTLFGHYVVKSKHPRKKGPGRKQSGFYH